MQCNYLTLWVINVKIITYKIRGESMKKHISLLIKVLYALSIIVVFHFFTPIGVMNKATLKKDVSTVKQLNYNSVPNDLFSNRVISTFTGQLTGYGPDCAKCSGITASGLDVRNGNIYYNDATFGEVRIVASSKKYKLGSILRIDNTIKTNQMIVIILDRGVSGNTIDLLFANQNSTGGIGYQRNVKFEILRNGW